MKAATRWNLLEGLLKSHIDCIEAICQVICSHPKRDIRDKTTSWDFVKKIMKHLPYLTHLKSASVLMQKRMASLEECQFHCDLVASCALNGYGKAGNHQKKDLRFQLIEDIIVLLKMKLNHPSISTGQGNQLVSLLPSAP
jgi:hypothetical protein